MSANFDGSMDITPVDSMTGISLGTQDFSSSPSYLTDQQLGGSSGAWGGLDTLGSTTGNVASGLLASFGNLVSAQVNQTALLTSTGRVGASLTAAQLANANAWQKYVLYAVLLSAVGVGLYVWKK